MFNWLFIGQTIQWQRLYYGSGLLVVEFALNELHLHRVEAGAMLDNIGSMRVLERTGFHK
jgi:RimJ/RimL family protein N-acetyltransferase